MSPFFLLFFVFVSIFGFQLPRQKNWAGKYAMKKRVPECHMSSSYPPPKQDELEWFDIDLDRRAEERWTEPVVKYQKQINAIIDLTLKHKVLQPILKVIQFGARGYLRRLPKHYGREIKGIANLLKRNESEVFILNVAYELLGVCTSIVAQDLNGHIYHARNLDFGLYPAMNWTDFQWDLTTVLRNSLFNINVKKSGNILYKATTFGGYIGLLSGVKPGIMSISVDSRFDNNYDKYLEKWLIHPFDESQFLTFVTRSVFEDSHLYDDAVSTFKKTSFIAPSYIIIGGVKRGQGSVLTFGPNQTLTNEFPISLGYPLNNTSEKPFYVLETNYDHWEEPPKFDDRRYPALKCMDEIGSKGMDFETLYNVLHALPNRNRLTTHTVLMDPMQGILESSKQYCTKLECSPW